MGDIESEVSERVVVVHALAGDEAAMTAALATLSARRATVTLVRCVEPDDGRSARAADALGITDARVLGSANARWAGRAERRYHRSIDGGAETLAAAEPGEIAADIAAVLIAVEPDTVITLSREVAPADPDRARIAEAVQTACEVIGVPLYLAVPARGEISVDAAPVLETRRAALAALGSDLDPARPESYRRDSAPGPRGFADLHLSTKIIASAFALIIGVIVGAILTAAHQATVTVGDAEVPWGLIVGLLVTACLFSGLRLAAGNRLLAGFAALGFLAVEALLALQSAGGSVLVPDNPLGYAWTWGPVAIALVVLAWPQITRPARDRLEAVPAAKGLDQK